MAVSGHSRRGRAAGKSGHVRYAPVATKFSIAAKCSDVPEAEVKQTQSTLGGINLGESDSSTTV
jgi:hypothetical protein